jgi:hypothetical protein
MIALALAAAVSTAPATDTAAWLLRSCESTMPADRSFCLGYVRAAVRGNTWRRALNGVWQHYCPKVNPTADDLRQTFIAYARANPKRGGDDAFLAVDLAVTGKWPCK